MNNRTIDEYNEYNKYKSIISWEQFQLKKLPEEKYNVVIEIKSTLKDIENEIFNINEEIRKLHIRRETLFDNMKNIRKQYENYIHPECKYCGDAILGGEDCGRDDISHH